MYAKLYAMACDWACVTVYETEYVKVFHYQLKPQIHLACGWDLAYEMAYAMECDLAYGTVYG